MASIENIPQRILLAYPFSTPCSELVEWMKGRIQANGFEVVDPSLQTRQFKEFRYLVQSVEGLIALCIPFDTQHKDMPSAWVHNYLGAIAAQCEPRIPTLAIAAKGIDVGGLARLDECRCPVEYPWKATQKEKAHALNRIERYVSTYFEHVRSAIHPRIMQVTVVLIDIVAFTSFELRDEQLRIADHAKHLLKTIITPYQQHIVYTSDGGDGGYFVFGMDYAVIHVLQFAQHVLEAFEQFRHSDASVPINVRIAIDCGGVGQGTSVANWRRSTLIGPPMNTCARILGHAGENEIVTTERFYQLLCGEQYAGLFSDPEVASGKRSERFSIRRYTYPL